jgi:hypothetical protein
MHDFFKKIFTCVFKKGHTNTSNTYFLRWKIFVFIFLTALAKTFFLFFFCTAAFLYRDRCGPYTTRSDQLTKKSPESSQSPSSRYPGIQETHERSVRREIEKLGAYIVYKIFFSEGGVAHGRAVIAGPAPLPLAKSAKRRKYIRLITMNS